ncbi:EamA family transporter [Luteimonas sp. RD2P54]|uniref:EamA family transporter n=1 Tax=Luteimonas endophytica TaxID=3042023 RepID=A0ABT6JAJ5_9GAMM|nr:EamA family transporter [Luteimonas endophytica]MDH5823612.1 EamA family transporter [Luteimonas endophytica]
MIDLNGKETVAAARLAERVPAQAYFVGSAIFHYLGPSFAVLLFTRIPVAGVAWLRIVSAAVVFALWRQPWRSFVSANRDTQRAVVALGVVLALMNYSFYVAIDRLPLGTVAAIEFLGPIVLALVGCRSGRNIAALLVAVAGVWLLVDVRFAGDPRAFAWAFFNAALFLLYIVLAHRVARADPGTSPIDRLGAALLVAGIVITPLGFMAATPALGDPAALAAGIGVGISSSVIPYVFDQLAMVRLPRATYALFVALLPATAVVVGVVVLRQIPAPVEASGVALVVFGIVLHRQPRSCGRG